MNSTVQMRGAQPLLWLASVAALLLVCWAEIVLGSVNGSALVVETLLGVPGVWLVFRVLRRILRVIERADLFSPLVLFPMSYLVWFTVGSIDFLDIPSSVSFGIFDPIPGQMWFYYAAGLISYFVGAYCVERRSQTVDSVELGSVHSSWDTSRFVIAVGMLLIALLVSYSVIVFRIGVPLLQSDAYLVRLQIHSYRWAQLFLVAGGFTLLPLLLAYVWAHPCSKKKKGTCLVLAGVTVLLLTSLGGRGFVFQPLLTTVLARHYLKNRYKVVALGLVLVLLFVGMSVYGFFREHNDFDFDSPFVQGGFPPYLFPFGYAYLYVRGSVATFRDLVSVVPSQVNYQHGRLTFQPLEVLLPGHHRSSDFFFKTVLGNDFEGAGQPGTLLAPLYGDFGLVGIIVGMAAFGALSMMLYRWMLRRRTVMSTLVYAWLVRTAILSLFLSIFQVPSDLWIPASWILLEKYLRKNPKGRESLPYVQTEACAEP